VEVITLIFGALVSKLNSKERLTMKNNTYLKYSFLLLAASTINSQINITPTQAYTTQPVVIAQSVKQSKKQFTLYMQLGYAATGRRDYRNALFNFRQAENIEKGNIYATRAIDNVSRYIALVEEKDKKRFWVAAGVGAPSNRINGATRGRGQNCSSQEACLTSLVPELTGQLTTSVEYPTILFYIAKSTAPKMRFRLIDKKDGKEGVVYTTMMPTPKRDSFIKIDFDTLKDKDTNNKLPPLKIGRAYKWDFSIIMGKDESDYSANLIVDGTILRKELDSDLVQMLQQATQRDRIAIYAANDLWYDFVAALYDETLRNPGDREIASTWSNLLEQIKLESIKDAKK
jgi:Domain of Unknown Function (DUF928)